MEKKIFQGQKLSIYSDFNRRTVPLSLDELVFRSNSAGNNNMEENRTRNPMMDSDEELEKELTNTIRLHKRNKKKPINPSSDPNKNRPIEVKFCGSEKSKYDEFSELNSPKPNMNMEVKDPIQSECVSELEQLYKIFFLSDLNKSKQNVNARKAKSLTDYTKQGAIPKKMFNKTNDEQTNSYKKANSFKKKEFREAEKALQKNKKNNKETEVTKYENKAFKKNSQFNENLYSKPFYYVVPEDPAPNFFFPAGTYYVIPKEIEVLTESTVFHPSNSNTKTTINPRQRKGKNNLSYHTPEKLKKLNDEDSICADLNMNIQPLREIGNNISEDNLNLQQIEKENLEKIKSALQSKIKILKSTLSQTSEALEELYTAEMSLNIASNLKLSKILCKKNLGTNTFEVEEEIENKTIEKQIILAKNIFPDADEQYLKEKIEECQGNEELFENFIVSECKRIQNLPDKHDETSDLLNQDECVARERLNQNFQTQLARMVAALPMTSIDELVSKCEELEGNEELITQYIENVTKQNEMHEKFYHFQSILPDADSDFIRREIEKLKENSDINQLINDLIESGDYPKVVETEEYKARKKLWETYVTNFSVREFLFKVPDVYKFLDTIRANNTEVEELALTFLESRFPSKPFEELRNVYESNNYNLFSTCTFFENNEEPIRLAMTDLYLQTFSEDFLQEISFIDHRKEITDYLDLLNERRLLEEEEASLLNAFLTCPLCTDDRVIASETATCPEGHIFCKTCVTRLIEVKLGDGIYRISCPSDSCNTFFTLSTLHQLLPASTYSKILKKQQAEEINEANLDGLESCQFCEFAYIPDLDDKIFRCQNPECLAEICRKCGEKNHIPKRCEEIERPKDLEARKKIEESMTNKLLRNCPACGTKFVKIDGCNKITCTCGTMICYFCRKVVDGYSHFRSGNTLNDLSLCPLYSENEVLHVQDVLNEGIQTRNAILEENPEVRILFDPNENF